MSESSPIFAVILAAGKGTRMKSNRAKVLHTLCGVPMVNYVIEATRPLVPEGLFVVVGHQAELVEAVLPEDAKPVLQEEQRGTGDARETRQRQGSRRWPRSKGKTKASSSWSTATVPLSLTGPSENWSSGTGPPALARRSSWPSWRTRAASGE